MMTIDNPYMIVNEEIMVEIDPGRGTAPRIINGRTMVPIRAIVEKMGGVVDWEGEARRVTLERLDYSVIMHIDSREIIANGVAEEIDIAPFLSNERTFLPIRFVAETLGTEIEWIGSLQRVVIVYALID